MNIHSTDTIPNGLFRHLYNHYEVRYPLIDDLGYMLSEDHLEAVREANAENLATYLVENSWLIGIAREDLAESVLSHWASMSPLARGDYLAAFTERAYCIGPRDEAMLSFIEKQLSDPASIEFSEVTACEIGCCLLAMGMEDSFKELLKRNLSWEQEIVRSSTSDARRWKTLQRISNRGIDIFLEAALVLKRPGSIKLILDYGANPDILIWQLERSSNALYPALSYAIKEGLDSSVDLLLEYGANVRDSDESTRRNPLALTVRE